MTRCQKDNINLKVQIVIKNTNIICAQPILSTIIHMIMIYDAFIFPKKLP